MSLQELDVFTDANRDSRMGVIPAVLLGWTKTKEFSRDLRLREHCHD